MIIKPKTQEIVLAVSENLRKYASGLRFDQESIVASIRTTRTSPVSKSSYLCGS